MAFEQKHEPKEFIKAWNQTPENLGRTARTAMVGEILGVHPGTARRILAEQGVIGRSVPSIRPQKSLRSQVRSAAESGIVRSTAQSVSVALLEDHSPATAFQVGKGLAVGLTLALVMDEQRGRVHQASAAAADLLQRVKDMASDPDPRPESTALAVKTYATMVDAIAKLHELQRDAWGITKDMGATSYADLLDQLDRATVVNGTVVQPATTPPPSETPPAENSGNQQSE